VFGDPGSSHCEKNTHHPTTHSSSSSRSSMAQDSSWEMDGPGRKAALSTQKPSLLSQIMAELRAVRAGAAARGLGLG
jgi:hypothetical protein